MANKLTTNLSPLVSGATAAASLAGLALVVPVTNNPSATKGYQPTASLDNADGSGSLIGLASASVQSLLNFTSLPNPLLFHYEGENTGSFESDITDHYVEDNTTLVDQIGLRPELVTVTGFIGELNNVLPAALQALQTAANTLLVVDSYQPQLGITALEKLNQAELLYESANSVANSAVSAWGSLATAFGSGEDITGDSGVFTSGAAVVQNLQQQMFQQFYGYWRQRTLFNVQTPWAIFTNMAIKSLRAIQDAETRMITNFEITFKKIRTASTQITSLSELSQGRQAISDSVLSNNGTTSGDPGSSLGDAITGIA